MNTYIYRIIITILLCVCVGNIISISSPNECRWHWEFEVLIVNCSNRGFTEFPFIKEGLPIEHLDLSHNRIQEFPKLYANIKSLIYLDLSSNDIREIPHDALIGFESLRVLILANNNIRNWSDINPRIAFQHAISLQKLSLAGNHFERFLDTKRALPLVSDFIVELDLSHCGITQVNNILSGMPGLERLILSGNNLMSLSFLPSKSLRALDVSNCSLRWVYTFFMDGLPNLEVLNLSWNPGVILGTTRNEILRSATLRQIDMSFCNLNMLQLSGIPNLMVLHLTGNMLLNISETMFANNAVLEILDLSRNTIRELDIKAFSNLHRLTSLDLSYNVIARIGMDQFRYNIALESINLSHNMLNNASRLLSNSLRSVNMSWCNISQIDSNAFSDLPALVSLDLSNNLIADIPVNLRSKTLKELDLSMCRLSMIRNTTFHGFPELASLKLSGNRFMSSFRPTYFKSNVLLDKIWLGDNQWHCDCYNSTFLAFYEFLIEEPQKLKDKNNLKCSSPTQHYGKTWGNACIGDRSLEIWTTILFLVLVLFVLCCYGVLIIISCFRKCARRKIEMRNLQELLENEAELEEITRQNRQFLEEEAQNATTRFESMLPSYEDALLMPKPNRGSKSMMNLSTNYKPMSRVKIDEKLNEEEPVLDNNRFRSEEMLLNRDMERTAYIGTFRRMSECDHNQSKRRRSSTDDSRFPAVHLKHQNLQSAEAMGSFNAVEEPAIVIDTKVSPLPFRIQE